MQMKNKEVDYFDMFIKAASISDRSAAALDELFDNISDTEAKSAEIHMLEHEGDDLYHELYYHLIRSFITPIDREDILEIAHNIEDTIDSIDEVSIMMNTLSVKKVREPAKELINLINKGCDAMVAAAVEFKHFKRSKDLPKLLVEINHIEEQGDVLFQSAIKSLFATEKDAIEVVKWQNIFNSLETVLDAIENVADIMEGVIVKNS
jgi:predicted phosphate transport protein (TIGR00153 family)